MKKRDNYFTEPGSTKLSALLVGIVHIIHLFWPENIEYGREERCESNEY